MSSSNPISGSSIYDKLIDQLILAESKRKISYEVQKSTQEARKSAVSTVGSAITSFDSLLDDFLDTGASQFTSLTPTSSDESFFTVSNAGSLNTSGSFAFEIQQLAKADTKVSARFNRADADLVGLTNTTFTLNVGSDSEVINVDISGAADNEDVLQAVADAINDSGLDDKVQATVLRETATTARLSIRSKETGSDYVISFSDLNTGVNDFLSEALQLTQAGGADNAAIYAGAGGGRLYNAGDLDAEFTIDGLAFTRSSNTVTDAITGLSIVLKKATTQQEEISIDADLEGARSEVDSFIESFNKINSEVRTSSFLNATSGSRGPLYSDRVFRELTITLRQTVFRQVDIGGGETLSLADIGIEANVDGSLKVADADKLETYLRDDAEKVQTLFSKSGEVAVTDNGLAVQLQSAIETFIGTDGLVTSLTETIDDRIDFLDGRIEAQETYLEQRRKILKDQYSRLEVLASQAQSQFQSIQLLFAS
jgi:flagellar hook-associated protein 2